MLVNSLFDGFATVTLHPPRNPHSCAVRAFASGPTTLSRHELGLPDGVFAKIDKMLANSLFADFGENQ